MSKYIKEVITITVIGILLAGKISSIKLYNENLEIQHKEVVIPVEPLTKKVSNIEEITREKIKLNKYFTDEDINIDLRASNIIKDYIISHIRTIETLSPEERAEGNVGLAIWIMIMCYIMK